MRVNNWSGDIKSTKGGKKGYLTVDGEWHEDPHGLGRVLGWVLCIVMVLAIVSAWVGATSPGF